MDDEKPDVEEVFEQVNRIQAITEFYLEDGALNGLSDSDAKEKIAELTKPQFEPLNPFDSPDTTILVNLYKMNVCMIEKTNEVDETGNACESGQLLGKKVEKQVVEIRNEFVGVPTIPKITVPWSERRTQKLKKNLVEVAVNLLTLVTESCTEAVGEVGKKILSKMTLREPEQNDNVALSRVGAMLVGDDGSEYREHSFKLNEWMAHLSPKLRKVPFTMVAIPGTHNSGTHKNNLNYIAPNEVKPYFLSLTPEGRESWGKCVKHDINQQLEMGIRYFDFRLKKLFLFLI